MGHPAKSHRPFPRPNACGLDPETQAVNRNIASLQRMIAETGSSVMSRQFVGTRLQLDPRTLLQNTLKEGYELGEELGTGGQGTVFCAIQRSTGKQVAIKCLHTGFWDPKRSAVRFAQEVASLARLRHPQIVSLIDCGERDNHAYAVMEYVAGREIDMHCRIEDLTPRQRVQLVVKVCDAVQYAHDNAVLHRDLKPSNILIDSDGNPHILDLGLAKILDDSRCERLTQTGQAVGSIHYWSPEQAEGREDLDVRTDVYSIGVLLYLLMTDSFPARRESLQQGDLSRIVRTDKRAKDAQKLPFLKCADEVTADLDAIIIKALQFDRADRYVSMRALAEDLRRFLDNRPVTARGGHLYRSRKFLRRHWVPSSAAIITLSTIAIAVPMLLQALQLAQAGKAAAEQTALDALHLFDSAIHAASEEMARLPGGQTVHARFLRDLWAYLPSLEAALPTGPQFDAVRANLLQGRGEVAQLAGKNADAEELFEEAELLRTDILRAEPVSASIAAAQLDTLRLHALAAANPWAHFEQGILLASKLAANQWGDPTLIRAYVAFEAEYAEQLRRAGRDQDAIVRYERLMERIDYPQNEHLRERQVVLLGMRQAMLRHQLAQANDQENFDRALDSLQGYLADNPEDIPLQIAQMQAYAFQVRAMAHDVGEKAALAFLEEALADALRIANVQSDRPRLLEPLGALYHLQADYLLRSGELKKAREAIGVALGIVEEIAAADPQNILALRRRQQMYVLQTIASMRAGELEDASGHGHAAVEAGMQLLAIDRSNAIHHSWHAYATWQLGSTFIGQDNVQSLAYYQDSLRGFRHAHEIQGSAESQRAVVSALVNTAAAAMRIGNAVHDQIADDYLQAATVLLSELDDSERLDGMDAWVAGIEHAIERNHTILRDRETVGTPN